MPDAGAGSTSGAVLGSGSVGKEVCGPRAGREEGVVWRGGAGEEDVELGVGFAAIADVERRFRGRWVAGFGDVDGGAAVEVVGGDRGLSGFGVLLPLLCADGGLELLGEEVSFCESDWERCRSASSDAFFLLSWLFVDRCPGVWLLVGAFSRGGSESSGIS